MNWGSHELASALVWLCWIGAGTAFLGSLGYFFGREKNLLSRLGPLATVQIGAVSVVGLIILWVRYLEVNHFPSQTMHEVIIVYSVSTLIAGCAIHFILAWKRYGTKAMGLGYLFQALIFIAAGAVLSHSFTLPTSQRDLPPALQSYWFPPHLATLILSYGTLTIAAILVYLYFSFNASRGILAGGVPKKAVWGTILFTFLVPWVHFVTIPLFVIVFVVAFFLHRSGRGFDWLPNWGQTLDEQSFRVFAVGFPFFTAGLMMGALWAQEAWANYWGWDSKEVTALITFFVYLIYLHLRFVAGWRGPRVMKVLLGGAISIFITFQLFGYLPDSQKSLHRYTDSPEEFTPQEGMQGGNKSE